MTQTDNLASATSAPSNADIELAIATGSIAASKALHAGMRAPLFSLPDAAGKLIALEDLTRVGPVVLHFIRGAWCSFSEQSLSDFAATHREVVSLGASAVAIAPALASSMVSEGLPVKELRDADMRVARQFGLAFSLPPGLRARYEAFGYAPPSTHDPGEWLVPIPATYLIDRHGTVVLALIDADYRNAFDRASLLTALKSMPVRRAAHRLANSRFVTERP